MGKEQRVGFLLSLMFSALLLAACAATETATPVPPTPTTVPATSTPVPPPATPMPTATPKPTATPAPPSAEALLQAAFETSQQASAYRFNGEMQITLSGPAVAGGMEIPARLAGGIQPPDRMQSTISACSQDRASAACQGGASASCPYGTFPPWLRYRDRLEMVRLGNLAPGNWPGICGLGTLLGVLERGHSQPVPWPGNKGMKVSNVKKVYTKEEIHQSRSCGGLGTRTTHTYKVHALTRDEQSVELVGGLKKQEQALFITQQVEKYLGI